MIDIKAVTVGDLGVNCYIITDKATGRAAVVDPGSFDPALERELDTIGYDKLDYILLTHAHFDHIGGVASLITKTGAGAKVVLAKKDVRFVGDQYLNLSRLFGAEPVRPFETDIEVGDGSKLTLGESSITVMATPGHTPGSVCYICGRDIFSGDTMFRRSAGRTDFPDGDYDTIVDSLHRLTDLDGDYNVYPGHMQPTTLDEERRYNPYL